MKTDRPVVIYGRSTYVYEECMIGKQFIKRVNAARLRWFDCVKQIWMEGD